MSSGVFPPPPFCPGGPAPCRGLMPGSAPPPMSVAARCLIVSRRSVGVVLETVPEKSAATAAILDWLSCVASVERIFALRVHTFLRSSASAEACCAEATQQRSSRTLPVQYWICRASPTKRPSRVRSRHDSSWCRVHMTMFSYGIAIDSPCVPTSLRASHVTSAAPTPSMLPPPAPPPAPPPPRCRPSAPGAASSRAAPRCHPR
mmetsp:Transcript_4164/g.14582  ORF Transcript_4164/g.14582 Transcript_4164/m.14582 type:complete len:204 (+) Transcript_4164:508-1119(+)